MNRILTALRSFLMSAIGLRVKPRWNLKFRDSLISVKVNVRVGFERRLEWNVWCTFGGHGRRKAWRVHQWTYRGEHRDQLLGNWTSWTSSSLGLLERPLVQHPPEISNSLTNRHCKFTWNKIKEKKREEAFTMAAATIAPSSFLA